MLTIAQFNQIMQSFGGFEDSPHIAVAVSGGSDSMALALLLHQWVQLHSGQLTCLIVDHQLRRESTQEAQQTYKTLIDHGMKVQILTWSGEKPTSRLQERAREKRYELLEGWCLGNQVLHLAVAHHGEDQWETVMYRLSKGADLGGLMGMQPVVLRPFGRILRPLLNFSKDDLRLIIQAYGITAVEDPSNQNDRFTRVRWRNLYPQLAALELDQKKIQQARDKWQGTYTLYRHRLQEAIIAACTMDSYGCAHIELFALLKNSPELQGRVVKKVIDCFAGSGYSVKQTAVCQLLDRLLSMGHGAATLGGCYLLRRKEELLIMRELRSAPSPQIITQTSFVWDNRFAIEVPESFLGMTIAPLSETLARLWAKNLQIHSKILECLPAIFHENKFVGLVHHLKHQDLPIKVSCFTSRPLVY
jgi:tRNA(Ile)-lysidine synthase